MKDAYRAQARTTPRVARMGLLAAAVAISIPSLAVPSGAWAEVHDPLRGYALDGTPVGGAPAQRGRDVPVADAPSGGAPAHRPAYASYARLRRNAAGQGLHLTSLPHRRGRSYFAMALNDAGHPILVMFNASNGEIVSQKDMSPNASVARAKPADANPVATDPIAQAAADGSAAAEPVPPVLDALAAAKAAAAKAAAAAAEAKQLANASAEEARRAQATLAGAEAAARREAQAKAIEERRTHRNDAKIAEAKRRALANAEARLAQAKAAQARIAADVKQAEALAQEARAAAAPAEMTKTVQKPVDMTPVAPVSASVAIQKVPAPVVPAKAPAPAPVAAEKMPEPPAPIDTAKRPEPASPSDTAKDDTKKSEAVAPAEVSKIDAAKSDAANSDAARSDEPTAPAPMSSETAEDSGGKVGETGGDSKAGESASEATTQNSDMLPTGSMSQSPPLPYHAPTPDEAAAAVEKH